MLYTPLAIATVADEAVGRCIDNVGSWDRRDVARAGAYIAHDIVLTGRVWHARDASSWNSVFLQAEKKLNYGLERRGLYRSPVEYVCRAVLDSCRAFVGLERRCGRGEE
jgi:hypothetical protein